VLTYARSSERRLGSALSPGYALDEITGAAGSAFVQTHPAGVMVSGELSVAGPTLIRDCLSVGSWVIVSSGHVATTQASTWSGQVASLKATAQTTVASALSRLVINETAVSDYLSATTTQGQDDYQDCATGDVTTVEFSLRDAAQYGTDTGLLLPEGRWQQLARQSGQTLPTWEEPVVVTAGGGNTLPHPGLAAWTTEASGQRIDLTLFNPAEGRAPRPRRPDRRSHGGLCRRRNPGGGHLYPRHQLHGRPALSRLEAGQYPR
jgi:hypothetical protein